MARTRWTPALVERRVREAVEQLGIDHMPTASQLRTLSGGNALACKVARSVGFDGWATRLGLDRSEHSSRVGWRGEQIFRGLCAARGLRTSKRDRVKCRFDVQVADVDVEVKTSGYRDYGVVKGWSFSLHNKSLCPVLAAVCLRCDQIERLYLIPRDALPGSTLSISPTTPTYAPYLNNWAIFGEGT